MIFDSIQNMECYSGIDSRIYEGLMLLKQDFSSLKDGRYDVHGDDLYFLIQTYETKDCNDTPEAHRKYVDIQFIISGEEKMGVAGLPDLTLAEEHPDRDFYLYTGPVDYLTMTPGKFAVLWPQDAHSPAIKTATRSICHKCVVKVRIA